MFLTNWERHKMLQKHLHSGVKGPFSKGSVVHKQGWGRITTLWNIWLYKGDYYCLGDTALSVNKVLLQIMIFFHFYFHTASQPFWNQDCSRRLIHKSQQSSVETKIFCWWMETYLTDIFFLSLAVSLIITEAVTSHLETAQQRQDSNKTERDCVKKKWGKWWEKHSKGFVEGRRHIGWCHTKSEAVKWRL